MKPNNLVEMVKRSVDRYPENTAFMWKMEGEYQKLQYKDFWDRIKQTAAGLRSLGVGLNDKVAILSNSNPMWPIADLAVCSLGAVNVPIYPTLTSEQTAFIIKNAECRVAIVENDLQVEKIRQANVTLDVLIVINSSTSTEWADHIISFDEILHRGLANPIMDWEEGWQGLTRDHLATIIHTSGTTGQPKGAMLTHGNFLSNVEAVQFWVMDARSDDVFLSYLPLSHVFERMAGQFMPLSVGATIAYAESIETIQENILEIKPTVMTSVPRLFEKVYAKVIEQIESGSTIKKKIFNWAVQVGMERYDYCLQQPMDALLYRELPSKLRKRWNWANKLVYSQVKERLGGRMRGLVSGGAALNPEIAKFFWAIDVPVLEGYGLTETSPVIAVNPMGRAKVGTVGKPLSNLEVRIDVDGEVLVRGPSVMKGYYKNEEATTKQFVDDWFRTGDIGAIDEEGYLKIIDRKKSLIVLSTGKNVAPQPIENAINQSVYIEQSVLVGHSRKFTTALVVPAYDILEPWSQGKGLVYGSKGELIQQAKVQELLKAEIIRLTKAFSKYEQPKIMILLGTEWTVESGEITPTLKVRMHEVENKYKTEIEKVYEEHHDRFDRKELSDHAIGVSLFPMEKPLQENKV